MTRYISQRIALAIATLFIILLVVYLLTAQFTRNPFAEEWLFSEQKNATNERFLFEQSVRHGIVADLPFEQSPEWFANKLNPFLRLINWVKSIFSETPFGTTYNDQILTGAGVTTIPKYFFVFLQYTLIVTAPVFVISTILGVSLGVLSGYKRGTWIDSTINGVTLVFTAIPSFVLAPIIITILLTQNIPPTFYIFDEVRLQTDGIGRIILSWLPPIGTLSIIYMSAYIAYTRNQVITVLTSNHVLIAKAKGLGTKEIFFKHVARNISIPLVTVIIPSFFALLSGGVVIETYWQVPGVSRVLVSAFPSGEVNLIMFNVFFFTFIGVFIAIFVDVIYVILDPRIKYVAASKKSIIREWKASINRNNQFKKLGEVYSNTSTS